MQSAYRMFDNNNDNMTAMFTHPLGCWGVGAPKFGELNVSCQPIARDGSSDA